MNFKIILFSLLGTIIFGFIDSLFFLIAEDSLQKEIKKIKFIDNNIAELATGGISASLAIFASSLIRRKLKTKYDILEYEWIDSAGIILGTIFVIIFYYCYKIIKKKIKDKRNRKNLNNFNLNK